MDRSRDIKITDVRNERMYLEQKIVKLLDDFTADTGMKVCDINFQRMTVTRDRSLISISYKVEVEAELQ